MLPTKPCLEPLDEYAVILSALYKEERVKASGINVRICAMRPGINTSRCLDRYIPASFFPALYYAVAALLWNNRLIPSGSR